MQAQEWRLLQERPNVMVTEKVMLIVSHLEFSASGSAARVMAVVDGAQSSVSQTTLQNTAKKQFAQRQKNGVP